MARGGLVQTYGVINLVFAVFADLGILVIGLAVVYGVFLSGDDRKEIMEGVLGSIILLLPTVLALIVYPAAGYGLLRERSWGFHFHIAGLIVAALSCIGVVYTVIGLIHAFKPEFKASFFGPPPPPAA